MLEQTDTHGLRHFFLHLSAIVICAKAKAGMLFLLAIRWVIINEVWYNVGHATMKSKDFGQIVGTAS